MTISTILFVCTGNTCRSPMAEGLAQKWLNVHSVTNWLPVSAGTHASDGTPISTGTTKALARRGIEFGGYSKLLTKDMVRAAHIILCMSHQHFIISRMMAGNSGRVELLDPNGFIADPVGQEQAVYDELAKVMEHLISERLESITRQQE